MTARWSTIRNTTRRSLLVRRGIGLLLLCSMLLSIVPVPMPVDINGLGKDGSSPFPCQDRPCGCQSADGCWTSCCCFTPKERIAWAKRHQVEIPTDALKSLLIAAARPAAEKTTPSCTLPHRDPVEKTLSHSAVVAPVSSRMRDSRDEHNCCEEGHASETWSSTSTACCELETADEAAAPVEEQTPDVRSSKRKYAIGLFVDRCRGSGPHWNAIPWCVLPDLEDDPHAPAPSLRTPAFVMPVLDDVTFRPPVPPPRPTFVCWV